MRTLIAPLLLSSALLVGISQCDTETCIHPDDGLMAAGPWGSEGWIWTVDPTGIATISTYCADGASVEPVVVDQGLVNFTAVMYRPAGPSYVEFKASFEGEICGDVLEFTYTTDDGTSTKGSVEHGVDGTVESCPIQ